MRTNLRYSIKVCFVFFLLTSMLKINGQTTWSVQLAGAIISRWPNSINDMTGKQWEYTNGIVLHGIEKIYEETGNASYLNYIKSYVDDFVDDEGKISFKTCD